MKTVQIKDRQKLNEFIGSLPHSRFLQSWEWGEFQERAGNRVLRLGLERHNRPVAAATVIVRDLMFGGVYLYCPGGPVFGKEVMARGTSLNNAVSLLLDRADLIAGYGDIIFIRFEPEALVMEQGSWVMDRTSRLVKTLDVQPKQTIVLDLSKTEDGLSDDMHRKTRYNIRLAEKKGVRIVEAGTERFREFWGLMEETVSRDGFRLHGREYYKRMLSGNSGHDRHGLVIKLYLAEYEGRIIAGNIVSFFGDTATYMHGASSNEHRNVMAPYLLQWHVIKLARDAGYKYYDLYGVDEHKWPGVTRFKRGFGGSAIEYPGTYDLVFNRWWYGIYRAVRWVRRRF